MGFPKFLNNLGFCEMPARQLWGQGTGEEA